MLMPAAEISVMVCWMVRPVPAPPFAQKVLPMYCSIGAPLGLVGSLEGSCRPSSPNQDPQCTGKTWPFRVIRPVGSTRNTALAAVTVKLTAVVRVRVPLVPVRVTLLVPAAALGPTAQVTMLLFPGVDTPLKAAGTPV